MPGIGFSRQFGINLPFNIVPIIVSMPGIRFIAILFSRIQ